MALEQSAEVQSVVRGLRRPVTGLEGRGRGGGRGAGGALRGLGRRHPVFGRQDLAEDDGEQQEQQLAGGAGVLGGRLAPDLREMRGQSAAPPRPLPPLPAPRATLTAGG